MNWQVAFKWARNLFAIVGVLGTLLLSVLVASALSMEAQYQRRAAEAGKAPAVSLENAAALMAGAGLARGGGAKLLAGVNSPWNDGTMAQAYCVQADINYGDKGWSSADALDPYLARSAGVVLDFAHGRLHCIPDAQRLREPGLQLKLLSLELDGDGIVQSRLALRDPASGRYYLVSAWRPNLPTAAGSTSVPSTD